MQYVVPAGAPRLARKTEGAPGPPGTIPAHSSGGGRAVNVAETCTSESRERSQPERPLQAPPQPPKSAPGSATASRCTCVPLGNVFSQEPRHSNDCRATCAAPGPVTLSRSVASPGAAEAGGGDI